MCYHACLIFSCGHILLSDLPVMHCRVQVLLTRQAHSLGIALEVQKPEVLERLVSGCQARIMSPDSRNLEHQKRPCDDCLLARMQKIKDQMEFDRLFDFFHGGLRGKFLALESLIGTVEEGTTNRYYTGKERMGIITVGISGVTINEIA
ncbi:hypothetical protein C7212DRAFT_361157 [Tuber magnatum]|uniref:Uncharacterized protein n=1 Tax=Tuber magnatum TaxID=42249 RepID=A0A317T428_9PEZI|nr:hypothetical protein C7212DRAFT_361157 [Tuber magnatum]